MISEPTSDTAVADMSIRVASKKKIVCSRFHSGGEGLMISILLILADRNPYKLRDLIRTRRL